jgi:hypothetical protein
VSQENVEIVRRALEAATRTPVPDFDAMNLLFDGRHEFVSRIAELEGGSHHGGRGYREFLRESTETLQWESRVDEISDIDETRVLAVMPTTIKGPQSQLVAEENLAAIVTVRDNKVVRSEVHRSRREALEAAGLSE